MPNETLIIALALIAMGLALLGFLVLGAFSFTSAFIYRLPGGRLSFCGVAVIFAMFVLARLMTSGLGLQMSLGPFGSLVEGAGYVLGGFLCVLGYARLNWFVWRRDRSASTNGVPGA